MSVLKRFGFPNEPYDIQSEFCSNAWKLYDIDGGIGIFESPTGTGKTLSILCSSLSWISQKIYNPISFGQASKPIPLWVANAIKKNKENSCEQYINEKSNFLKSISEDILTSAKKNIEELTSSENLNFFSNHFQIIISSRTHTQLMQFVEEFIKIKMANKDNSHVSNIYSIISLASRSHLCLHNEVKNYPNHLINDICKIYSSEEKKENKCPFKENYMELAKKCLIEPMSIEELCKEGHNLIACPYYAAKEAGKYSDIILAPYSIIFNKTTRESFGIFLDKKKTFCFIDEAHNLINALESNNRASLTLLSCQILGYSFEKFISINNPVPRDNFVATFKQLARLVKCIHSSTSKIVNTNKRKYDVSEVKGNQILLGPLEFINSYQINTFDLIKIINFIIENELCNKIKDIIVKFGKNFPIKLSNFEEIISYSNSLFLFKDFIAALVCSDKEFDKIVIETNFDHLNVKQVIITVVPINIQASFTDVFANTKSTMLVGGTLEPLTEFQPLLSSMEPMSIVKFSANHHISNGNLMCLIIPKFIDNSIIDLRYEYRTDAKQLLNLCELLSVLSSEIPNGICVFFTSHNFLDVFFKFLISDKNSTNFHQSIIKNKKIFKEKRKGSNSGKELLTSYKNHILNNKEHGAILFAVLNGTLSEGVNFSDELCRCLIIVSLPFPQKTEMLSCKEKYFNRSSGDCYKYENMYRKVICMKTVNQCIGRAIRHRSDYSSILLVDHRYNTAEVKQMLPRWIAENTPNEKIIDWNFETSQNLEFIENMMLDHSDNLKDSPNEVLSNENMQESDSDLFGESDSVTDQIYNDIGSFIIEKDNVGTHRYTNDNINCDAIDNFEDINNIRLQVPVNYFGIDNSDRVLLTLKLPERLKVVNKTNIDDSMEESDLYIKGGVKSEGDTYSNSKLVSWSDGTYSLFINNKLVYDCVIGCDKAFIFDDTFDQKYKMCLARIDKKLTIRPRTIEKSKLFRDSRSRAMIPTTLEEINQHEFESKKRVDELNAISSIKSQQKRTTYTSESKRKQMTSYFLEESSEESV
ncbi:DNA repair helicase family [Cryptosporidium sp. chipmunk genotype I]|uniref:DNA repair helicase family n=1 Tax=Cryptosporidium sp. chipmunk genotype I TaxID=1280935 RepID=UPI00351A1C63|nr:DNA repair helicase family [Cryptosporidium sp. chipmunk genotype I]